MARDWMFCGGNCEERTENCNDGEKIWDLKTLECYKCFTDWLPLCIFPSAVFYRVLQKSQASSRWVVFSDTQMKHEQVAFGQRPHPHPPCSFPYCKNWSCSSNSISLTKLLPPSPKDHPSPFLLLHWPISYVDQAQWSDANCCRESASGSDFSTGRHPLPSPPPLLSLSLSRSLCVFMGEYICLCLEVSNNHQTQTNKTRKWKFWREKNVIGEDLKYRGLLLKLMHILSSLLCVPAEAVWAETSPRRPSSAL